MREAIIKLFLNKEDQRVIARELGYYPFFNWSEFENSPQFIELSKAIQSNSPLGIDFACSHHVTLSNWGTNWSSNEFCARSLSEISIPNTLIALDPHIIKGAGKKNHKKGSGNPNWTSEFPETTPIMLAETSYSPKILKNFNNKLDIGVLVCPSPHQEFEIIRDAFQMLKPETGVLIFIPDPETDLNQIRLTQSCDQEGYEPVLSILPGSPENLSQYYLAFNRKDYQNSGFPDSYYIHRSNLPHGIRVFTLKKLSH